MLAQGPPSPPFQEENLPDDKSNIFCTPPSEEALNVYRLKYLTPFSEDGGGSSLTSENLAAKLASSQSDFATPVYMKQEAYSLGAYGQDVELESLPGAHLGTPEPSDHRAASRPRRTAAKRLHPGSARSRAHIDDSPSSNRRRKQRPAIKPLSEYAGEFHSVKVVKAFDRTPPSKQGSDEGTDDDSIEVLDTLALASRSISERQAEAQKSGKIKRPYNAFILYRMTYQVLAQRIGGTKSHQSVSTLCGDSWASETHEIKYRFQDLAQLERQRHMEAFPNYKFQPKKEISRSRSATREVSTPAPEVTHDHDGVLQDDVLFPESNGLGLNYSSHYQVPAPPSIGRAASPFPEFADFQLNMFPQYGNPSDNSVGKIHMDYAGNGPGDYSQYVDPQLFHGPGLPYFSNPNHLSPAAPFRNASPSLALDSQADLSLPSVMDFPVDDLYLQGRPSEWELEPIGIGEPSFFDDAFGGTNGGNADHGPLPSEEKGGMRQ